MRTLNLLALAVALFSPQGGRQVPADVKVTPDVEYGRAGEISLKLNILEPKERLEKPMPVVVFIHGGGWLGGSKNRNPTAFLAQEGYFTVSIDYCLSGVAKFPAQIHDCKAAIRFLRKNATRFYINPDRIGVWGSSAGGHLTALMGTSGDVKELEGDSGNPGYSSRVQAAVDFFGPADFLNWEGLGEKRDNPVRLLLGCPVAEKPELARQASPVTWASKDDPPFLIFHGENDRDVPVAQSKRLHDALNSAGVDSEFVLVKNAGHGFGGFGQNRGASPSRAEINRRILAFFDKHLKR